MMYTALEHAVYVVSGNCTLQRLRESSLFGKCVHVNGMEKVTTVGQAFDLVGLVIISLGGQIPRIGRWVDDTSTLDHVSSACIVRRQLLTYSDSDQRIDICTWNDIRGKERNVQVS